MYKKLNIVYNLVQVSWVFNGYPILMHAISIGNEEIVNILIDAGAIQKQEALGFALEEGLVK